MKIPEGIKIKKSVEELNLYFYEKYDEHFYFNKARTLWFMYHADEETQNKFESFSRELNAHIDDEYQWKETLTAELYFSSFMQFEALFGLLVARFQKSPHWIYLNNYSPSEIKKKIQYFLDDDISALTDGLAKDKYEFIDESVYSKQVSPQNAPKDFWRKNLHEVSFILKTIADKYLKNQIEYNGYKHGLRFSKVAEAQITIPWVPPFTAPQTIGYIDTDIDNGENILIHRVKSIDPRQSYYELYLMHRIVRLLKMTRLLELGGKKAAAFKDYPPEQLLFGDLNSGVLKGSQSMNFSLLL